MKRPVTAARRYAEAAFQIATRDGAVEAWQERLDALAGLLADERMDRLAAHPALPGPERERIVREALGWAEDEPASNLVRLLVRRGRTRLAAALAREFHRLVQRSQGMVEASVVAAAPLSDAEETAIRERVEAMTGARVQLTVSVDPTLIGGVAVRIGDRLIDASVRGRLERLREQLVAGAAG
jgi:F-type H+-transporting ATPase subunit delta